MPQFLKNAESIFEQIAPQILKGFEAKEEAFKKSFGIDEESGEQFCQMIIKDPSGKMVIVNAKAIFEQTNSVFIVAPRGKKMRFIDMLKGGIANMNTDALEEMANKMMQDGE